MNREGNYDQGLSKTAKFVICTIFSLTAVGLLGAAFRTYQTGEKLLARENYSISSPVSQVSTNSGLVKLATE